MASPGVSIALTASAPKSGRDPGENDDRVGATPDRFALADGASTAARPELWAELLVAAHLEWGPRLWESEVLDELRAQWLSQALRPDLPWYAVSKLREGGASTLVCLSLDRQRRAYCVRGVGDSCLFHVRDNRLLWSTPIDDSGGFTDRPVLISTLAGDRSFDEGLWSYRAGYQAGDQLVLASDALSKTLLRVVDADWVALWTGLLDQLREDRFDAWVDESRAAGQLDNDDTSICVVPL